MESPPGWNPGILYSNWIPRKIPRSRLQRSGSKTGYGLYLAHPTFRLASACVYILLPFGYSIIFLLLLICTYFIFIYRICTLIMLMLWAHNWRWSHHPDETRKYFTATGFRGRYLEAVFRDRVRKLGMGFIWPTQPFGWPPHMSIFYYFLIIQLFPYYCWLHTFCFYVYQICTLVLFNAFHPWQLVAIK